ncbi:MAG: MaoC family dehydratase [Saprospiraceae bacterium]|nr:MaoC family dehydratase [Saprospiraceae bacterium]
MMTISTLDAFREMEGQDLPVTDWMEVSQEMVNHFAEATGDFQWIHVDVERAKKESPFGGPIAHGFFSVSLASKFIMETVSVESVKMGVNYGLDKVRFPHPVPVGSRVRMHTKVTQIDAQGPNGVKVFWDCTLEIDGVEKPACVARFISLMFE